MKKVCIVGATGYIGSELLVNLKKNYKIISVSRKKVNKKKTRTDIFKEIIGDIKLERFRRNRDNYSRNYNELNKDNDVSRVIM